MSKSLTVTSQETIYSSKNYHRQKKTSLNFGHSYWQSSWHFFLFKSALLEKSVTTHKNHNFSVLTCIRNKYEFCKPSMFVPGKFKNNSGTIFYQAQTETNHFLSWPLRCCDHWIRKSKAGNMKLHKNVQILYPIRQNRIILAHKWDNTACSEWQNHFNWLLHSVKFRKYDNPWKTRVRINILCWFSFHLAKVSNPESNLKFRSVWTWQWFNST